MSRRNFVQIITPGDVSHTYVGKARNFAIDGKVKVENVVRFSSKKYERLGAMEVAKNRLHVLNPNSKGDLPLIKRYVG
ncbi:MAG: hypothetical protein Q4A27_02470 [bacterium]|nr:hypothetical protein [bacterium]